MRDFFHTVKFKVLMALVVVLAGVMTYAAANGRLTAAPQELLGAIAVPFQKMATAITNKSEAFVNKYISIDKVMDENEALKKEISEMRAKMTDYAR